MSINSQRVLKTTLILCVGLCLLFLASRIILRPDSVSDGLMRLGGRVIKKATMNTKAVAIFTGIVVFTVWVTIAIFAWREGRDGA